MPIVSPLTARLAIAAPFGTRKTPVPKIGRKSDKRNVTTHITMGSSKGPANDTAGRNRRAVAVEPKVQGGHRGALEKTRAKTGLEPCKGRPSSVCVESESEFKEGKPELNKETAGRVGCARKSLPIIGYRRG
jgi:hypothetical protein